MTINSSNSADPKQQPLMSSATWAKLQRQARREERKLHARLTRAIEEAEAAGDEGHHSKALKARAQSLQRRYLSSYSVKLVFLVRANNHLPPQHREQRYELVAIAKQLDLFNAVDEEVRVSARLKSSGVGDRITCAFGIRLRAAQGIVVEALKPYLPSRTDARQKTIPTASKVAGTHAVVRDITAAIDQGAKWVGELDVNNCFPSIRKQMLIRARNMELERAGTEGGLPVPRGLPLPRRVIENIVLADQLNLSPVPLPNTHRPYGSHIGPVGACMAARQGIPQGSRCSSMVAELVIADIVRLLPEVGTVRLFADNVFVAHAKKKVVQTISMTLLRVFDAVSAGQLTLHARQSARRVCDGLDILGYRVARRRGRTTVRPSKKNINKLYGRLLMIIGAKSAPKIIKISPIIKMIRCWSSAFPEWGADHASRDPYWWCGNWADLHLQKKRTGIRWGRLIIWRDSTDLGRALRRFASRNTLLGEQAGGPVGA